MKRILVLDDELSFRQMLRQMLERAGYLVIDCYSPDEAETICRSDPPDLLITDICMPERNGLSVIMDVCQMCPEMKILAVSGGDRFAPEDHLRVAESLGAHRTLAKPFLMDDLLAMVQELFDYNEEASAEAS